MDSRPKRRGKTAESSRQAQGESPPRPDAPSGPVEPIVAVLGALPSEKLRPIDRDLSRDRASNQATARLAAAILAGHEAGYVVPTARQREAILVAFVREGYVVYGKAFDVVHLRRNVDLNDEDAIRQHLDAIVLCEVKSTRKENVPADFRGHFFSLSTAELLVAQNLGSHYRFVFVNTHTKSYIELSLSEMFARSRGIYPSWSIMF